MLLSKKYSKMAQRIYFLETHFWSDFNSIPFLILLLILRINLYRRVSRVDALQMPSRLSAPLRSWRHLLQMFPAEQDEFKKSSPSKYQSLPKILSRKLKRPRIKFPMQAQNR